MAEIPLDPPGNSDASEQPEIRQLSLFGDAPILVLGDILVIRASVPIATTTAPLRKPDHLTQYEVDTTEESDDPWDARKDIYG